MVRTSLYLRATCIIKRLAISVIIVAMLAHRVQGEGRGRRQDNEAKEETIYDMAMAARDTVSNTLSEMFASESPKVHAVKQGPRSSHNIGLMKASIACKHMDVNACEHISNVARRASSNLAHVWLSMAKQRAQEAKRRREETERLHHDKTMKENYLASMYMHQASLASSQADLEGDEADKEMNDAEQEEALGKECLSGSSSACKQLGRARSARHLARKYKKGDANKIIRVTGKLLDGMRSCLQTGDPVICKDSLTAATAQGRMDEIKRNQAG